MSIPRVEPAQVTGQPGDRTSEEATPRPGLLPQTGITGPTAPYPATTKNQEVAMEGPTTHEALAPVRSSLRKLLSFSTYSGLVPSPGALRPFGISAMTMARNEEEWVETSIRSLLDHVDEIIVADHGSEDGTPEILNSLANERPDRIRLVSVGNRDFPSAINFVISKTKYRWILRWHADFIARTSGPHSIDHLGSRIRELDPRRHYCIGLSGIALDGDLNHQFPKRRDAHEPFLYTFSPWLRYTVRARWESLHTPWFYERQAWREAYYFHMRSVKSKMRMLQKLYWSLWFDARNKGSTITLREFIASHAVSEWGGSGLEDAAKNYVLLEFQGCIPYSRELCGDYPDILIPALRNPPFKLVFRDGRLVDRIEKARYRPREWPGE